MQPPTSGFWGPPAASVDWCEANYAHSHYVCELFNTVSSLMMVLVGLVAAYWHRNVLSPMVTLTTSPNATSFMGMVA
jgi:dihydroceramidase